MGFRFVAVVVLFSALYGSLAFRFYNLQIRKGDFYAAQAASQILGRSLDPARGNIFMMDKNNTPIPVAVKKDYPFVYCVPEEMAKAGIDLKETAFKIEDVLDIPAEDLIAKLDKPDDPFEELAKVIPEEKVSKVKELDIPGLYVGQKPKRYYPYNSMASHVLGFVSGDEGQYGIEAFYEGKLSGKAGEASGDSFVAPTDGQDVYLTIDQIIQARAEKIISDAVSQFNAKGGMIIVSNPKTGEIKAMAGSPSFDPNNYGSAKMSDYVNPNVQRIYEPGSVFKLITMAAAIDSGSVTPDTVYEDTGSLTINSRTIKNWDHKAYGRTTMTEVIEHSLNLGAAFAAKETGKEKFLSYIEKFGFDKATGIDLPGEVIGSIKPLINGRDINYATASYGQGISVSPIRMLTAVNSIANNGIMMAPRLTVGESREEGRPISAETAKTITNMMVSAVKINVLADIKGYDVAGKTGTAMVPDFDKGGYKDSYINTFIGFAPAYDPKFSILVRIDEPEGNPLAGASVIPPFKELAEFILSYYGVAPDNIR
ncbi:MAG: penicillin-binding protein 2 [Candidatus Colwellbacteria bacterium]|jgi:cell division protein FtsI/penicillin-binding protein 2|nr:penicillin-binding protein 2 [Candidatus Colwellbacteria bacterium]MCK9497523.1 penicillin-binding protein 2 [Candidatus Colwellbacteria bacterium]MDD3752451.1 penicillin-binding protein 2 [Candidatus Colwellbacteria bacterium]MDD4818679.1 penicillin-binding protein 2 [Candidatus Colwellbacteria bacterium]